MTIVKDLLVTGDLKAENFITHILNLTHPIGSYYWSSDSTNPHDLFGGTWTQITDKFIYAAGSKSVNSTGGEETLSHDHNLSELGGTTMRKYGKNLYQGRLTTAGAIPYGTSDGYYMTVTTNSDSAVSADSTVISQTGAGLSLYGKTNSSTLNNMPPYIVAYCWKRIS